MLLSCSAIRNVWIDRLTTCRDVAVVVVVVVVVDFGTRFGTRIGTRIGTRQGTLSFDRF